MQTLLMTMVLLSLAGALFLLIIFYEMLFRYGLSGVLSVPLIFCLFGKASD